MALGFRRPSRLFAFWQSHFPTVRSIRCHRARSLSACFSARSREVHQIRRFKTILQYTHFPCPCQTKNPSQSLGRNLLSLRARSLACHCERSEAISIKPLGINSAISSKYKDCFANARNDISFKTEFSDRHCFVLAVLSIVSTQLRLAYGLRISLDL